MGRAKHKQKPSFAGIPRLPNDLQANEFGLELSWFRADAGRGFGLRSSWSKLATGAKLATGEGIQVMVQAKHA